MQTDLQLAKLIYHAAMSTLKFTLELEEQKYKEKGRQDPRYRFFKKLLMAQTYDNLKELFEKLRMEGILEKTDYPEDLKNGYKEGQSGGSGYINSIEFQEWIDSGQESTTQD